MKKWLVSGVIVALAATAIASAPAHAAPADLDGQATSAPPSVEPGLRTRAAAGKIRVNVVTKTRADLPDAASTGQVLQTLSRFPMVTLRVDAAALDRLATRPGVVSVSEDRPVPPVLAESVPLIGGDRTRAAGLTGAGSAVAVLDTGVATGHPFLGGRVIGEACFSPVDADYSATSLCPNGTAQQEGAGSADSEQGACADPALDCDHGTHVAGIAVGNGQSVSGAPPAGVAPGASLVAIQVFSKFTSEDFCGAGAAPCVLSFTSAQVAGLEKVLQLKEAGTPLVAANLSLGSGRYTVSCDTDPRKQAIDGLLAAGVATVVAAGNNGYGDAVSAPACVPSAITVGSTTDDDTVSAFSNRGPLLDLFAPGTSIVSSVPGDGWAPLSGTSMAAPHVTGALAVLRQAFPQAGIAELESAMKTTGKPIAYTGATTPRLRLDGAALPQPTPTPTPTPPADPGAVWPPYFVNMDDYAIPDRGRVDSPIDVSDILDKGPAQLHVWVSIRHPWVGDLKLQLISPDGKVFPLREPSPDGSDFIDETYDVDATSVTTPNGTWKLRATDDYAPDSGFIDGWSMDFPFFENWDDRNIPDKGVVTSPITVTGWLPGNAPAKATVYAEIHHTWVGDLKIDLISPNGMVYKLRLPAPQDNGDVIWETYPVDGSASPANGTWTLRVEDVTAGDTGYLDGWWIKF
ncbi:S8 family serine peptidase [Nonomuraea sp. NPDC050153]|uniref:S8 family serine peptidase n=1 Tax=Nonomuraea sp. NPDC050153 TaxID=3364359 RepID=UPI0037B886BC